MQPPHGAEKLPHLLDESEEFLPGPRNWRCTFRPWPWRLWKASRLQGEAPESSPKTDHQGPSGHQASQPTFFLPGFPAGGAGCRQERSWDPAQVALSVRLRPAQGLRLRGALRITRGLMGLVLNWSQAVDFSQGAKCIIKWQKGSTLHVKDNGGNLLDGL